MITSRLSVRDVSSFSKSVACVAVSVAESCMNGSINNCESVASRVGNDELLCALQELNSEVET